MAFGVRGATTLRYRVDSGSRLDAMPVFQDVRVYELLSLLHASGFDASVAQGSEGHSDGREPRINVRGDVPFGIQFAEPSNDGFLTIRLEARLAGDRSAQVVENLNRSWWVGAAALHDGHLVVRQQISITGGVSHAGLRDGLVEWVVGLSEARRLAGGWLQNLRG
jgi:hypothetical protein